jgi:hypothetical protein
MRRIGHQDEMREALAERHGGERREIDLAVDVGIDEQERRLAQQGECAGNAACRLERLRFVRIAERRAEASAVAQPLDDRLGEMRYVEHDLLEAGRDEALEMPDDERLAADFDERLRDAVGKRPQPLAAACREQHGLHSSSSSSGSSGASAA